MEQIWQSFNPPMMSSSIARLAVGAKYYPAPPFSGLEKVLAEIVTGDFFGADRMDYLLRDSLHAGVAYGRFDVARLVQSLRILPTPTEAGGAPQEPRLGVEEGGLHAAEALLLARYFMFTQVYFHRLRRIFDLHLQDFVLEFARGHFASEVFPTDPEKYIHWTDAEITAALLFAARDPAVPGHEPARRIVRREPFKLLWQRTPLAARSLAK